MKYKRPDNLLGLIDEQVECAKNLNLINYDYDNKNHSVFVIIKKNLFTFFNFISLAIAIVLFAIGSYKNMLFLGVAISNLLIGTVQEIRAKKINDKLSLISKSSIQCIRNNVQIDIFPDQLVLYDLIILDRGSQVPSDCEIEAGDCAVDESVLTGESEAIHKKIGNILLSGSFIIEGKVYARIIRVNKDNYISQIQAEAKKTNYQNSKLLKQINNIIKISSTLIIPIAFLLYIRGISLNIDLRHIINSVSAALIGMMPSGLVLLTSVSLAVGVVNLSKINTLVNQLSAIENLARVDTLCLDKTGTITSGNMNLEKIIPINNDKNDIETILKVFLKNSSDTNQTLSAIRNSLKFYDKSNIKLEKNISFNSSRKWSAVYYNGVYYCMGATSCLTNDAKILNQSDIYTREGKRVLLLAETYANICENSKLTSENVIPICFIVITDEIRNDASNIINYFYDQDVNVKLVSGDNINTVKFIADKVGIKNSLKIIDSKDLKNVSNFDDLNLFGRTTPVDKKNIIVSLQNSGHTVAMCGDGVNDLPAMKCSDCAIAMGSGNDAVKSGAQLVLLDNCFSNMPLIVNEGRRVINNISLCASLFLNKTFISALISIICGLFAWQYPFQPIQLTLISACTIGIPSFFYAVEPNNNRFHNNFMSKVLKHSIPTAIAVSIMFSIVICISRFFYWNASTISTISSYNTAILLFISLWDISKPVTKHRGIVMVTLWILFTISSLVFGDFFAFESLSIRNFLILIVLSIVSYVLYKLFRKISNKWKITI